MHLKSNGLSLVLAVVIGVGLFASDASAQAKKLFFLGNSFTRDLDIPGTVARIAGSTGRPTPTYFTSVASGADFDYHIGRLYGADSWKLTAARYDMVIMQGLSFEPTRAGDPADYRADAVTLARLFRQNSYSAKFLLEQTWAYHPYNRELYPYRIPDAPAMNLDLLTHTWNASFDIDRALSSSASSVAAVGDIIRYTNFRDNLYGSDWKHQSQKGGIVTALTLYLKIYGDNVSDIPYSSVSWWAGPKGIDAGTWSDLTSRVDSYYFPRFRFASVVVPEPASACCLISSVLFIRRRRA